MALAGFGGGHPFDLFVEEDGFDAGGGEGEVEGGLELFDPVAGGLEVVDHFSVADLAAADVEGGLEGGGHAGEEGEGDGEEVDEEADAGGGGLVITEVKKFVAEGPEDGEEGGPGGPGGDVAEAVGEGGGFGEFGAEVVELIVDALVEVAVFEFGEFGGGGAFAEEGEGGGEGEAVPVGRVVFALGVEGVEDAGGGFDAAEEFGGEAAVEPGLLGAEVVMGEHEGEGDGDEDEFDAGEEGEAPVVNVGDVLAEGGGGAGDDGGHAVQDDGGDHGEAEALAGVVGGLAEGVAGGGEGGGEGGALGGDLAAEAVHDGEAVDAADVGVGEAVEVEVAACAGVGVEFDDGDAEGLGLFEELSGAAGFAGGFAVEDSDDGVGAFEHLDVGLAIAIGGDVAAAGDADGGAAGAGPGGVDEGLGAGPVFGVALEVGDEERFGFGEDDVDGEAHVIGDFAGDGVGPGGDAGVDFDGAALGFGQVLEFGEGLTDGGAHGLEFLAGASGTIAGAVTGEGDEEDGRKHGAIDDRGGEGIKPEGGKWGWGWLFFGGGGVWGGEAD